MLLANKADVNQVDPREWRGVMPLHLAAEVGSAEAVELLIAAGAGAELDALTTTFYGEGDSALQIAAYFGNWGVAELLLKRNANPNLPSLFPALPSSGRRQCSNGEEFAAARCRPQHL